MLPCCGKIQFEEIFRGSVVTSKRTHKIRLDDKMRIARALAAACARCGWFQQGRSAFLDTQAEKSAKCRCDSQSFVERRHPTTALPKPSHRRRWTHGLHASPFAVRVQ